MKDTIVSWVDRKVAPQTGSLTLAAHKEAVYPDLESAFWVPAMPG